MVLRLIFTAFFVSIVISVHSQVTVTGKVIDRESEQPLPGVNVLEKGTANGTVTDGEGMFTINVGDPNDTLIFSFIGYVTQKYPLRGQTYVFIKAKEDCIVDFFDSNQVTLYVNSGTINTPVGGQIKVNSPWVVGGVVKGAYSYQTNLNDNKFQAGQLELTHFIVNCNYDIDFRWGYRNVSFKDDLRFKANSFEADLNLRRIRLVGGYSVLNFDDSESSPHRLRSGVVIGISRPLNVVMYPEVSTKVALYKNRIEYQAEIQGHHKRFCWALRFYRLASFHELTLSIGYRMGYVLKRRPSH